MRRFLGPVLTAVCLFASPGAFAVSYVENFDGPTLSPFLTPYAGNNPSFALSLDGVKAVFTKPAGVRNGAFYLDTKFELIGDFQASVDMFGQNLSGSGEAGVALGFMSDPIGFADIFTIGPSTIWVNFIIPTQLNTGGGTGTTTTDLAFSVRRTGNTVAFSVDRGNGFEVVRSATHPTLARPVIVELFLVQENNNPSAHAAHFDNLSITADAFSTPVPETSTTLMLLIGSALVPMVARRRRARRRHTRQEMLQALD